MDATLMLPGFIALAVFLGIFFWLFIRIASNPQ